MMKDEYKKLDEVDTRSRIKKVVVINVAWTSRLNKKKYQ